MFARRSFPPFTDNPASLSALCYICQMLFMLSEKNLSPWKKNSLTEGNVYRIHLAYFLRALYSWDSFSVHVLICSSFTTLSGSCERIHISNSKLFKIGMFFNRNTARNHWRENVPLHICLNVSVMVLLVCSFWQMALQMLCSFTINCATICG